MSDLSQLTFDIRFRERERERALWHIPCTAEGETDSIADVNLAAFFNYFNVTQTTHFKCILENRIGCPVICLSDIR